MAAMGLLAIPDAYAGPPALPPGKGRRIVIIGAGIAGMVLAWELRKAGFAPLILEARNRAGGRNWTLRRGDEIRETGGVQRIAWDAGPHMYFNPGPARLPYHHEGILSYCRDLRVPLEVMSNDNRGALLQSDAAFDGRPQRNRQVINDIRGYIAELAAKAIDHDALTQAVTTEDKERIRALLRSFGALDQDMTYKGSGRAGYSEPPGGGVQAGTRSQPLDLRKILDADFWQFQSNFGESWHQAATMMQPVGGMGRIGEAFGRELVGTITYGAEVRALRRTRNGARIVWRDAKDWPGTRDRGAAGGGDHPVAGAADDPGGLRSRRFAPRSRRWTTCRRSRSPFRRSGGSGNWTTRSTAASPGPRATSPRSGIPRRASTSERAFWSAPISGPMTSARSSPPCRPPRASRPHWTTANGCIRTIAGI